MRRGRQEAQVVADLVGGVNRFFYKDGVGSPSRRLYVHGVNAVDIPLVEAAASDGQLLLGVGLEMFGDDRAGQQGMFPSILGHAEDAPADEAQQDEAGRDGDGDIAGCGALYDEGFVRLVGGHSLQCFV